MGLTQKLGTIPLAIQTDSSNNVGIGGAANASYKLAVTGASLFSSSIGATSATFSDTVAITLTASDSRILGGNSTGRLLLANSGTSTYGIFYGASHATAPNAISLVTDNTERMRIDNAGFVGIGTGNPSAFQSAARNLVIGSGVSENFGITIFSGSTTAGSIHFADEQTSGPASYRGYINYTHSTDSMQFGTLSSERMRITSGGQVQIKQGANTFSDGLRLINSANAYWGLVSGGDTNLYLGYNSPTISVGVFNSSTGTYTATSDINKKKDFEQSTIGLDAVLGLKPTLYRMKTDSETTEKHLGFIAQEVKEFIPQAYSENTNGDSVFIGLTEMPIIAALVKAIQELSAKVTALENK